MRKIKINTPDGGSFTLNAPDNATPEAIKQYAQKGVEAYKAKHGTQVAQGAPKEPGMASKVWNAMDVPRQAAQQTISGLTKTQTDVQNAVAAKTGLPVGTEPTGNLTRDILANTPRILGESAAEVLPSFVDRTSILTAGAGVGVKGAGMVASKVLPKVAPMLEAGSGLRKGTLVAANKDASIITDFGSKAKAAAIYNEAKQGAAVGKKSTKVVADAFNEMNKGNHMTAPSAFKARKVVRQMLQSKSPPYPTDDLLQLEEHLGEMVFRSVNKADALYKRAIQGEQMRNISRLNKNGTTGPMSAAVMAKIPALAPLISPAVQGAGASVAGATARIAPSTIAKASAMPNIVAMGLDRMAENRKRKKEKRRG